MESVKYGISTKFIVFISLTLVVFLAAILLISFGIVRRYALTSAEELASTILEETDRKIDQFFLEIEHLARGLANYKSVYNVEVDHMKDLFVSLVLARKHYLRAIYLGTEDGRMFEWGYGKGFVDYTPTLPEGYDPRERPWYRRGLQAGGFTISEPYIYASVEALGITGVVPVHTKEGRFVGILGLDILLDDLGEVLETLKIPKQGKAVLLNKQGEVIASQLSESSGSDLELKKFEKREMQELLEKQEGYFIGIIEERRMYFSFKMNETTKWILVLALPYDSIMLPVKKILLAILMIDSVLMIMLILALGLICKRMIIKPLGSIVAVMKRLENGERQLRVEVRSRDEFGVLAGEFNRLADTVEAYSSSLEEKVRQRTAEIAQLQQENTRLRIIEEKKRIYRDMHDALGAKLTNIFICNNVARSCVQKGQEKLGDMLERIEANCQLAFQDLKKIILDMKDDERIAGDFARLARLNIKKRLDPRNIELKSRFRSPEQIQMLSREFKDEMEKILEELVSNVLKHSGASKVFLTVSVENGQTRLVFRDDGVGFDYPSELKRGSGLNNISYRVEGFGGRVEVCSSPGQGSEFRIIIPGRKEA